MTKNVNYRNKKDFPKDDQDVVTLLKKMQYQLNSLEEKVDSLLQQSKRSTFRDKHFSKPYKEYDKTRRPKDRKFEGKKEGAPSEGKFYHGQPFNKKKDGGKSSLRRKRKPFSKSFKKGKSAHASSSENSTS